LGIRESKSGKLCGRLCRNSKYTESHGYGVVVELAVMAQAKTQNEDPEMPNYGKEVGNSLLKEWL
jgi:hypothetical protein